jgi:hypothetical protein
VPVHAYPTDFIGFNAMGEAVDESHAFGLSAEAPTLLAVVSDIVRGARSPSLLHTRGSEIEPKYVYIDAHYPTGMVGDLQVVPDKKGAPLAQTLELGQALQLSKNLNELIRAVLDWWALYTDAKEREKHYNRLGWSKGPYATAESRNLVREFWVEKGTEGAKWLIERISRERHIDALEAVANLLAEFGAAAVGPILNRLRDDPTRDEAEVLLNALSWIETTDDAVVIDVENVANVLEAFFSDTDPDIRAAAYYATRILPRFRAASLLSEQRSVERDGDAIGALNEALQA